MSEIWQVILLKVQGVRNTNISETTAHMLLQFLQKLADIFLSILHTQRLIHLLPLYETTYKIKNCHFWRDWQFHQIFNIWEMLALGGLMLIVYYSNGFPYKNLVN
jgi:hypothetical protein